MTLRFVVSAIVAAMGAFGQPVDTASVVSRTIDREILLPGEFLPFENVIIYARVAGFVEQVLVDRGTPVRKGEKLITLVAPELKSQVAEAEMKAQSAEAQRAQAAARLAAAESTYTRLKEAATTPGAVSGNELTQAEQSANAARADLSAQESAAKAARAAVRAARELENYLTVSAPFAGMITERMVHPGALAGPAVPLLRLEQVARLRLVVAVPEENVGAIPLRARVSFHVPAFPGRAFFGTVSRVAHQLDPKTRTMSVELDVQNADAKLAPGMFPEVAWPVRNPQPSLLVPASAVVTTTEKTFVIRVVNSRAEWVTVKKGPPSGDLVSVIGDLQPGDRVIRRGTDEIRNGAGVAVK